jgi:hypothetical protein
MAQLTDKQCKFIAENPYVATATTLRQDGSPHNTIVWVDAEDAKKYLGKDEYPWRNPEEQRIKIRITPEKVDSAGFDD